MFVAQLAQAGQVSFGWWHDTHIPRDRLDDETGNAIRMALKRERVASRSLYAATMVQAAVASVTPGLVGFPVSMPAAGLNEKPVGVTVIASGTLHDQSRPVAARARRIALMVASVPLFTKRPSQRSATPR